MIENYAQEQFDLMKEKTPGAIILKYKEEILNICKKMANEGHSVASASMYRQIIVDVIDKLLQFKPINPINNTDDEWIKVNDTSKEVYYKNKFYGSLFKDSNGKIEDIDLLIKNVKYRIIKGEKTPCNGGCWSGAVFKTREDALNNTNRIKVYIKKFPYYVPKTFYLDMIEEEIDEDSWIMWMNNPKQLEELDPETYEITYINNKI